MVSASIPDLLAIDPGTTHSAWVRFVRGVPTAFAWESNQQTLRRVLHHISPVASVVCEQVESYGMPVGREVFETVRWCGRYEQAFTGTGDDHERWHYLPRRAVKLEICNSARANDASIRQALIDMYGGKDKAIGRKAAPGPLYGVSGDVWAALAVGITFLRAKPASEAA